MDLVDKSKRTPRQAGVEQRQVSPYLQRPLRSLEQALADLRRSEATEPAQDLAWERLLKTG